MTPGTDDGRPQGADDRPGRVDVVTGPMTPERWEQVEDLLLAALELPEADRFDFLSRACAGDDALLGEVESLLQAHASPGPADRLVDTLGAGLLHGLIDGGGLEGETVGRYEIEERLGRGGMGIVYRAWDPRLERHVALKVLPGLVSTDEASRRRLLAEAQMAAGLDHPNICTIHEIGEADDGQPFIAMPLYDGETVRARLRSGPFGEAEAVRLALQAARGLARAHDSGVIHRDIKPSNLVVTRDGTLKILDFGIARPEGVADPADRRPGTAGYVSPERVAGLPVDARSDLWSLGVVLYEMLAGRRPFEGATTEAVRDAIAHDAPPPLPTALPRVSPDLAALVDALLQKDPARRPGSAAEVADTLRDIQRTMDTSRPGRRVLGAVLTVLVGVLAGVAVVVAARTILGPPVERSLVGPGAGERLRIAILPLAGSTDDPRQDYLAEAVTEQLIATLSEIEDLAVMSHAAMLPYRDRPTSAREVAEALDLDAVVEGSVARSGDEVRLAAALVDGETEARLWAGEYTRDFRELEALQKEVVRDIAREADIELSPAEERRLRTTRPVSAAALDAYNWGRYLKNLVGGSDSTADASLRALKRAVELEPDWAEAHAELASSYHFMGSVRRGRLRDEYFSNARAAAERAIRLDESLAAAHAALGFVLWAYDWDVAGAEREYRRALELAPGDDGAYWGWALLQQSLGRYDLAVDAFWQALAVNPNSGPLHGQLAHALGCAGRFHQVIEIAERFGDDNPDALLIRGRAHLRLGETDSALSLIHRAVEMTDSGNLTLQALAHADAYVGREQDARTLIPVLEALRPLVWMPEVYAAVGETERLLDELERGYEERLDAMRFVRCRGLAAYTDVTRIVAGHPRMEALERKMGWR